jgi:hypothetical protein
MQLTEHQLSDRSTYNQSNWYFVQPTLSGTVGVIIGFAIANYLGWI